MQQCSNCKTGLSCGCQRRIASDGKPVCTHCIARYELALQQQRNKPPVQVNNIQVAK